MALPPGLPCLLLRRRVISRCGVTRDHSVTRTSASSRCARASSVNSMRTSGAAHGRFALEVESGVKAAPVFGIAIGLLGPLSFQVDLPRFAICLIRVQRATYGVFDAVIGGIGDRACG